VPTSAAEEELKFLTRNPPAMREGGKRRRISQNRGEIGGSKAKLPRKNEEGKSLGAAKK